MGRSGPRSRQIKVALGLASFLSSGCGSLMGLDEFRHGSVEPENLPCGALEVPAGGACVRVGVPQGACGDGFVADGHGGCDAILPAGDCSGALARPGDAACVPVRSCGIEPPVPGPASRLWFVRADAPDGGDGDPSRPFNRISDAIAALGDAVDPTVVIEPGDYLENLHVDRSIRLVGSCAESTRLIAAADRPAVVVTERAKNTRISGLDIVGGSAGVLVDGATGVEIADARILHTEGPGVSLDGREGLAAASISATVIEDSLGGGVVAYGGNVSIEGSTIRRTRAPERGHDACGICMRPSGEVPMVKGLDGADARDPRRSAAGSLSVIRSSIEDNAGSGISIVGVFDARITRSVVRATGQGDLREQDVGIEAEERAFGYVRGGVHVRQSLVAGVAKIGIRGRNAYVTMEQTTVRDIGGLEAAGNGRCLGNGVRVLWDRVPEDQSIPGLTVTRSLVERTRETGVLIEGALARIDRSIVRDTSSDPCAGDLGDGVAAYGLGFAPARVELTASRVDGSARAAVASFGSSSASLDSSVLRGDAVFAAEGAGLVPALLGGAGCNADDATVCIDTCSLDAGTTPAKRGTFLSPELGFWIVDHDEISPVRGDANGCAEVEGLPPNTSVLRAVTVVPERGFVPTHEGDISTTSPLRGFAPALAPTITGVRDSTSQLSFAGPLPLDVASLAGGLLPRPDGSRSPALDLRAVPIFAVGVCKRRPDLRPWVPDSCRSLESRVPGVSVFIDSENTAYYPISAVAVEAEGSATTNGEIGSLGLFVAVPPGERVIRLTSSDPKRSLTCVSDTGAGWQTASALPEANAFRVVSRPGFVQGVSIFCD